MKWFLNWLLAVLLGVIAALTVLYFNPLTDETTAQTDTTAMLRYELGPSTLAFTHGDRLGLDLQPQGVPALWEVTINNSVLGLFDLKNRQGSSVAIATRISKLSRKTNPVTTGIVVSDHWLVTVPGAGSYFIESSENLWPLLRDTVVRTNLLRRPWEGVRRYQPTEGPEFNGAARVTGTTGRFKNARGTAVNTVELRDYVRPSQLRNAMAGELSLNIVVDATPDSAATNSAETR